MSANPVEGDVNNNETELATASGPVVPEEPSAAQSQNELLDIVFTLESEKQALLEESRKRIGALRKDFEVSFE